jgi:biotin carboxyl carrier protein
VVEEGQPILILEAMKMQNEYVAPMAGTVGQIHADEGVNVEINTPLITLVPMERKASPGRGAAKA